MCLRERKLIMKKIFSALMALSLAATATMPVFAYKFSDIEDKSYSWAASYIEKMNDAGYITGYEDGTFRPDNEVTRLEGLALFARAMGSNNETNKELLEIAHEDYDNTIKNYSLAWGTDEIAYLMYKGVLKKSDLDTYLLGTEKDTPMSRYEAAIIITKALGGERDESFDDNGIVLDYADAKDIPSTAVKYVYYATKAGIMNGMGDGKFSPKTSVSRAQMAVMLARTVEKTDYSFKKAKLMSIADDRTVTYKGADGTEGKYVYTDNTVMRALGTVTQPSLITTGVQAIFGLSGDELVSIDTLSDMPDETVTGVYKSYTSSNGNTYIQVDVDGKTSSYQLAKDVSIIYGGSPSTIRAFSTGDAVSLSISGGLVESVVGKEKEVEVKNLVVDAMDIGDDVTITVSSADSEYNGKTFTVASDVIVLKNSTSADLSKVYTGDTISITLQYNKIIKIVATSTKKTVEGTISSLTIASPLSSMVVSSGGTTYTYEIPADVTISVNGEKGSLYDFRVGDSVKLSVESNAITAISATTTQTTSGQITGVVAGINSSYGFISVTTSDGNTQQIFCKDTTTKFITASGTDKKMSGISVGQTITARGTITSGAFMATLVIIESEG